MKKTFMTLVVSALCALPLFAGDSDSKDSKDFNQSILDSKTDYFRAHEWDAEAFGSFTAASKGFIDSGFGGGIGGEYFFTRYFGFELDGVASDGGPHADTLLGITGNFVARLPLEVEKIHFAPYAFIGGGVLEGTHVGEPTADVGAGVEYRYTPHIGFFTDASYDGAPDTNRYVVTRLGVKYAF